jgi:ATP-dependent helicase HrpA
VRLGTLDPAKARELFIQHALVEGQYESDAACLAHNRRLQAEVEALEAKARRRGLLQDEQARFAFYDRRLPPDVVDSRRFEHWRAQAERREPRLLHMSREDLLAPQAQAPEAEAFPDALSAGRLRVPLEYRFAPGEAADGVTLSVPAEGLAQLDRQRLAWLVPGLLEEKVEALIRSLPKALRTRFVPVPETAHRVAAELPFGAGSLVASLAEALTRLAGERVPIDAFQLDKLPEHLRMNVRVLDAQGQPVAEGRDLAALRGDVVAAAEDSGWHAQEPSAASGRGDRTTPFAALRACHPAADPRWHRDGLTDWPADPLPESVEVVRGGVAVPLYPAVVDQGQAAGLRLLDSPERAAQASRGGLRRLFALSAARDLKSHVAHLPHLDAMTLHASGTVDAAALRRDLAELLAERALAEVPLPRDEPQFRAALAEGRRRLGLAAQDVAALVGPLWAAYHEVRVRLEAASGPKAAEAAEDIRRQLDRLVAPGFLAGTPWDWLRHYPRYFKAARLRLEKLLARLPQDRRHTDELAYRWRDYDARAELHRQHGIDDPELEAYRWMLEEYRVSLFAQELGTAVPVSAQRLDRQWSKVRG